MNAQISAIAKEAKEDLQSFPLPNFSDGAGKEERLEYWNLLNTREEWVNRFVNAYNRIAYIVVSGGAWKNPLDFLFRDNTWGYAIEELFVNITRPREYDPFGKGEEQWKRVMPDVRKMLHTINVETTITQTIYEYGIRRAFTSEDEWAKLRDKIIIAIQNTLQLSLYSAVKYTLALYALEAGVRTIKIGDYQANPKSATEELIVASDEMTFFNTDYNPAGVYNFCAKDDQYLLVTPRFNAKQDVEVLAYAFNIDVATLPQRKIMVDNLWNHDYSFLSNMFAGGVPHVFTEEEIAQLKEIPAMLFSKNLLFIYKSLERLQTVNNGLKLYWNYIHHWQGTFSYSPFECGAALYTGEEAAPEGIVNPYESTEIREGRDNLVFVRKAFTRGPISSKKIIDGVVTGEALIPQEEYPGWYRVVNEKGKTSTITYSYEGLESLVITLTSI